MNKKIGLISSHGGHLTELLELAPAYEGMDTFYYCYDADTTRKLSNAYLIPNAPYNPFRVLSNFFKAWKILREEKPDCLLSTGAELAVPPFLIAKWLGIPTIYIECGAQVTTASFTGRLLIRIANEFYIQWPELKEVYGPKAKFVGSLIDEMPKESTQ
jgi:UDP-N-acetylglucosamine:LPS N-acetylglucosamine transferase